MDLNWFGTGRRIDSAEWIKSNSHRVWYVWPSKLVPAVHAFW